MHKYVPAALLVVAAAGAAAQNPTSSNDRITPPGVRRGDAARTDPVFRHVVACVVRRDPPRSRNLVNAIPGTNAESMIFGTYQSQLDQCYPRLMGGLGFTWDVLRGGIAEYFYHYAFPNGLPSAVDGPPDGAALAWARPRASGGQVTRMESLHAVARCVVLRNTRAVTTMLAAAPFSAGSWPRSTISRAILPPASPRGYASPSRANRCAGSWRKQRCIMAKRLREAFSPNPRTRRGPERGPGGSFPEPARSVYPFAPNPGARDIESPRHRSGETGMRRFALRTLPAIAALASAGLVSAQDDTPTSPPPRAGPDTGRTSAPASAPAAAPTPAAMPEVIAAATCVIAHNAAAGDALFATPPYSAAERTQVVRLLGEMRRCVHRPQLVSTASSIRGGFAEAAVKQVFATPQAPRTPPLDTAPLTRPTEGDQAYFARLAPMYQLADCATPRRPDLARAVLANDPATPAEAAAVAALNPTFISCVAPGTQLGIDPRILRFMLAEALYRWSVVQRDGPASPWAAAHAAAQATAGAH